MITMIATRGRQSFRFRSTADSRYVQVLRAAGWTVTEQVRAEVAR